MLLRGGFCKFWLTNRHIQMIKGIFRVRQLEGNLIPKIKLLETALRGIDRKGVLYEDLWVANAGGLSICMHARMKH